MIILPPMQLRCLLVCKLKDELELIQWHHQQECFERSHVLELGAAWRNHLVLQVGTSDAIDDRLTAQGQRCQIPVTHFLPWVGKGAIDKRINYNTTNQLSFLTHF